MQAITTKYFGPTDKSGSRIKATASAGSVTLEWSDCLNAEANHARAAEALAKKYQWDGTWYGGVLPDGITSVYVCADPDFSTCFTVKKWVRA